MNVCFLQIENRYSAKKVNCPGLVAAVVRELWYFRYCSTACFAVSQYFGQRTPGRCVKSLGDSDVSELSLSSSRWKGRIRGGYDRRFCRQGAGRPPCAGYEVPQGNRDQMEGVMHALHQDGERERNDVRGTNPAAPEGQPQPVTRTPRLQKPRHPPSCLSLWRSTWKLPQTERTPSDALALDGSLSR